MQVWSENILNNSKPYCLVFGNQTSIFLEERQHQSSSAVNNNNNEEFLSFSQQVHEMSDELEEDEKSFLLEDKPKHRSNWNNSCKRATGVKHARLVKSASNGRVVATHLRPVGKEVMQRMLDKKKKDQQIKIMLDDDDIWKDFNEDVL